MRQHVLASVMVLAAAAATADEGPEQQSGKDWCLLRIESKCSGTTTFDLAEKTRRLEAAVRQGTAVYTPEELDHLKAMLEEARQIKQLLDRR